MICENHIKYLPCSDNVLFFSFFQHSTEIFFSNCCQYLLCKQHLPIFALCCIFVVVWYQLYPYISGLLHLYTRVRLDRCHGSNHEVYGKSNHINQPRTKIYTQQKRQRQTKPFVYPLGYTACHKNLLLTATNRVTMFIYTVINVWQFFNLIPWASPMRQQGGCWWLGT